ncbi:ubiquinol-cytochrome-c reductase complex assembly factor 3-like isoform X1 [Onychostruthus taczanowskii]|uniref:ubiquinol-cytochrome-c reductase complex assembly factor 3-like n=1 Tax=Onychostruthus taczanowskii TaxID=356909 RepID=UPI001B808B87|nr:ubiquinol-cytochrome-c reductase complex assembly factor 3-like [Onychostruthus taczanowskii]XP_041275813.1 ubiquinol-cytochrome-c reductase complex assembly factor 3-like isoform X1 [Onychostruthus taczanowskii]
MLPAGQRGPGSGGEAAMALDRRWPLALARGAVPVALGLLLWVAIAGGEHERQQTLKGQPGADAALAQRRRHNELIMAALREAAETDDNVAHRGVPWRK